MRCFKIQSGFSLVELIIVIVIVGILATGIATFITLPVQGFIDLSRRATLVYSAESALRRMQRDIRRALPNSIRVAGGGTAIEMINTRVGMRYRSAPPPGNPDNRLTIVGGPDTDFDVFGDLTTFIGVGGLRVSVNNTGDTLAGVPVRGLNAYALPDPVTGTNVVTSTPAVNPITITNGVFLPDEDHINIGGGGFQFTNHSLNNRVYLVDGGISYVCNGGQLTRYSGYNFTNSVQPVPPAGLGETVALMSDNVGNCAFTYVAGTPQRSGLMTLDLTVTDAATGESVRLLHQVHVDNVP